MDPKDFKFDDNAFDDVMSSSEEDKKDIKSSSFEDEFEDIFSGKEKDENEIYRDFTDEYFSDEPSASQPSAARRPAAPVEKKPYSYNYSKASQEKARRVSRQRIYDDVIEEDISSGKQPREKKSENGKKKKKKSGGKIALIILLVLLIALGGVTGAGLAYAKSLTKKVDYSPLKENEYISSSELKHDDAVRNILLIGVDAREGEDAEKTRSDTMMLLSIDTKNNQLKLTSFLRDTYIEIPGYKWRKLNAAQSRGGTQLLVDTLEYNYKIDIDNYMLVNFDMFITIIDSLGGIDVEVTEKEAKYINSKDHMTSVEASAFPEDIQSGPSVHLTGAQALWYSRIRYLDSDFMRTQRQRKVITAIVNKAKANPAGVVGMLDDIMPMIKTDLSSDELMSLGMSAPKYISYTIAQQQIPANNTYKSEKKNGEAVLTINLDKNREILSDFIYNKVEVTTEETTGKNK